MTIKSESKRVAKKQEITESEKVVLGITIVVLMFLFVLFVINDDEDSKKKFNSGINLLQ